MDSFRTMYKLQVVLVPPNSFDGPLVPPILSATAENSQLLPTKIPGNASSIAGATRPDGLIAGNSNNNLFMSSFLSSHIPQPKFKKFLHFTKPSNTLLVLAEEIVAKCNKIYPNLKEEVEIVTLQDVNECDLDPDFIVKDVFNADNVVRAILRDEIDTSNEEMHSLYASKRRKLNNSASVVSNQQNVLHIAKKRPHILKNSAMRISTPLANQIYPPPGGAQINSDYEDDEVGDRSVLPPPQPQSPPIRISSGIDHNKKMNFNEDAVSKSETVDPDKSRQHRLSSGTPMRQTGNNTTTTPNRIVLTGQRVVTEPSVGNRSLASPIATNKRITSGMLRIPEPKISEVEEELKEGPASPSAELPSRPERIPMKKQYIPQSEEDQSGSSSSEDNANDAAALRIHSDGLGLKSPSAARQTSIADNNGSPIKEGVKLGDVSLAELPNSQKKAQRKSSLESKVESLVKNAASLSESARESGVKVHEEQVPVNHKDSFSDEEDDADEEGQFQQDPNDTVRVNHVDGGSSSFQKSELLSMLKGNKFEIPLNFNEGPKNAANDSINQRVQRNAAKKAAELLSSGKSRTEQSSSSSSYESSDIETDLSEAENDRILVLENHALRKLNIHPLKERVIGNEDNHEDLSDKKTSQPLSSDEQSTQSPRKEDLDLKVVPVSEKLADANISALNSDNVTDNADYAVETAEGGKASNSVHQNSPSRDEISSKLMRAISPAPADKAKIYQTPEFVEDSDDENEKQVNTVSKSLEKKLPPSVLKRKEEAEKRRKEREALKKAKEEELAKKKADREAKKQAKERELALKKAERAAKKKAREEETLKRKAERDAKQNGKSVKKAKSKSLDSSQSPELKQLDEPEKPTGALEEMVLKEPSENNASHTTGKVAKAQSFTKSEAGNFKEPNRPADEARKVNINAAPDPDQIAQYFTTAGKKSKGEIANQKENGESELATPASKLETLKSKFSTVTFPKSRVTKSSPNRDANKTLTLPENESSSDVSDEPDSSGENDSSGDSSEEETSMNKKLRRGIVDTPRGVIASVSNNISEKDVSAIEIAPQSTQKPFSDSAEPTPAKVPVTRMMELSSPANTSKSRKAEQSPTRKDPKPGRSLSSLSDLVSRGVPEVKDGKVEKATIPRGHPNELDSSSEEDEHSDDESEEESDESESSDSSDDEGSSTFISAKSASKALGRKKKSNSGFASLVKDSKKR